MERRTRQRIFGLFVIAAFIIILLPFFQGTKELSPENALIATPPFPNQTADISSTTTTTELKLPEEKVRPHDESPNNDPVKTSKYRIIEQKDFSPKLTEESADDRLLKLNSTAWVVQVGSFKDKIHALQLVNQLRANGYRAFIQEISTALEETTRVYIGPEQNQANAMLLVNRLQDEMHIKGMILTYKPLTL